MARVKKPQRVSHERLPMIPLRGLVAFPGMTLHFDVGRDHSVSALEHAMEEGGRVFLVTQRDAGHDNPQIDDLYSVGTIAHVKQAVKLPGQAIRVLVEGEDRALLLDTQDVDGEYAQALVKVISPGTYREDDVEIIAHIHVVKRLFLEVAQEAGQFSPELMDAVGDMDDARELCDMIASNALDRLGDKQEILECADLQLRMDTLVTLLSRRLEVLQVEHRIQERVKKQIDKNQREYYLREQLRAIQKELGDKEPGDTEELRERMLATPLSEEARAKVEKEIDRLSRMSPGSPEITVSRTYIEWILDMPWGKESTDDMNLKHARAVLEADHYGLAKVKERILEFLAVHSLKNDMTGPILCLVGPPGVGKTSIARSVARALGRSFERMSLGGVRDEAEIRGHRRTYIGALPGGIISAVKQAGTMNPVILFDEIDKLSSDYKGDPASAMLEVLDAEQNKTFRDHYLEIQFDLSKVLFLTTANSRESIPRPLLDRMEVIELSGYTDDEKQQIAKRHLLPKQLAQHGLKKSDMSITDKALLEVIDGYTRESGVRTLERQIGAICRKAAIKLIELGEEEKRAALRVTPKTLPEYLGAPRYLRDGIQKRPEVGIVNGLAWTSVGGETLKVEVAVMPGSGTLDMTGQLGDVMKESARAAMSYIRARADKLHVPPDFHQKADVHIHVPEGAVPKDGPSAGVTMTCALVSALTGVPARQDVAMTGEITLRGKVLPIGGVKEKVLAAHRMGIDTVLLPLENRKDLEEVPESIRKQMNLSLIGEIGQALDIVLDGGGQGTEGKHAE